ncbi:FGGY-family carbohydrate kinase [Zongyangia hominis]|uniref:Carbohydrate kinase n=1 Tax=Zongyangia hominis TaxID=2763677 RepID=A0A926IAU2_9FIRM|nr:FGGY-family carbohydrate kinase [Zongyangia hominis]MBC8569460.1 hypothetical protein [Zongyangia hominis]
MALAGLDIGTSGCKFSIMDEAGQIFGTAYHPYEAVREGGCHELDGNVLWEAAQWVIKEAASQCPGVLVEAFAVSTLGESAFPFDKDENIIGRGALVTDTRGMKECGEISEKLGGPERMVEMTSMVPRCTVTIGKVLWIKRHTDIYERATKFLLTEDMMIYLLTGKRGMSYSTAARTMAFDNRTKQWSKEVFDAAGIDMNLFSPVYPSGTVIGTVKPELAKELGLSPETKVCTGGMDQACCAIGSGLFKPGICLDVTGTCQCNVVYTEKFMDPRPVVENVFNVIPDALDGGHYIFDGAPSGGVLLQWFRDNLDKFDKQLAKDQQTDFYKMMDAKVKEGPSGLLITPDFSGMLRPDRTDRQAVFLGVSLETKPVDIYRGLMEGLAFRQRMMFEVFEENGVPINEVHATGGGSKSPVWMQLKADITGRKYTSIKTSEAGTVGCALLAGLALGKFPSLREGAKNFVRLGKTYTPNPEMQAAYEKYYQRFRKIGPMVDEILRDEIDK